MDKLKGYKVECYSINISKREQREKLVKSIADKWGKLDVLVCN